MPQAIIYDGFIAGSTMVSVRVPGIAPGTTVYLYNEDSLTLLGSEVATSDDVYIEVTPLAVQRIIAFTGQFGDGTGGGVAVLPSSQIFTGWKVPAPVDEEAVPEGIGLFNPGSEHPLTARYDPLLKNSIPAAYRAAAIELISEPIVFDKTITYRVDEATGDPVAIVQVLAVRNARGAYTVTIDGTVATSKNIFVDKTFDIVVEDSESRTETRSVTVNPVTGYMPVAPAPTPSSIKMYMFSAFQSSNGYIVRADARSPDPLEISYDGGTTYQAMVHTGTQNGSLKDGMLPGSCTVVVRVISDPGDFVTETIPVPYP